MLENIEIQFIHSRYEFIAKHYTSNTSRKNYFLAVCCYLEPELNLDFVNDTCPYGGIIGINDSKLDLILNCSKVFRLHAALHDAFGYMKTHRNIGPGYSYVIPSCINHCLIGHPTGLLFCLYLKIFKRKLFKKLEC